MAVRKPLVLGDTKQIEQLQPGDTIAGAGGNVVQSMDAAQALTKLMAVQIFGPDEVDRVRADTDPPIPCVGLILADVLVNDPVDVQFAGIVTGTAAEWEAVGGGVGGLTAGTFYYLSDTNDGGITPVAPSTAGHFVQVIGFALNSTDMMLQIGEPVLL